MKNHTALKVLSESVQWDNFFNLVNHVGSTLNSRKDRFDKADIFETALEVMSSGTIAHVDEVGCDHVILDTVDPELEMKTARHCLISPKGNVKKTCTVKLMNSLGDCESRTIDDVIKFDNLLIVDTGNQHSYSVAMISKQEIREEWLDFKKDGVIFSAPTEELRFIKKPEQLTPAQTNNPFSYKEDKKQMQRVFINQFV